MAPSSPPSLSSVPLATMNTVFVMFALLTGAIIVLSVLVWMWRPSAIFGVRTSSGFNDGVVYADNNASTPVFPEALRDATDAYRACYANPSSIHSVGRTCNKLLERNRQEMASMLGAQAGEIVFTGGATESNNIAIRGVMKAEWDRRLAATSFAEKNVVKQKKEDEDEDEDEDDKGEVEVEGFVSDITASGGNAETDETDEDRMMRECKNSPKDEPCISMRTKNFIWNREQKAILAAVNKKRQDKLEQEEKQRLFVKKYEDEDEDEDEEETSKGDEGDEEADGADYTVVELPGIILTPIEHASVYETVESLKDRANVSYVRVDPTGRIDIRHFEELARRSDTVLACVIMGNNEIGTVQDVRALSHICKRNRVHLHCDMTQIVGRYVVNLHDLGVDTATMSAHKFHGPKGVGALYVRRGTRVTNFSTTGGSQELSYRGGTENIGGICGMVSALEHCHYLLALGGADEVRSMRDFVRKAIVKEVPDALLNGHPTDSMYNTLSLCVPLNSRAIVKTLDEAKVYVNVGCACSKGADSKTLMAIGRTPAQVNGSLRISLSYLNTMHECQRLVSELLRAIKEAKATRAKVMAKKVEKVETSSK